MKKQTKTKIGLGFVVKAKVGELENTTREGIIRRMRKEVVGCVQSVVGKTKFLAQFEYGQKKDISSSLLVFLSSKEEVDINEAISHFRKKYQGELLTIVGYLEVGGPCMFGKGMYLYVFYCLCYVKYRSTDMSEEKVSEESDPYLNKEEDIRLDAIMEDHWKYVA